MSDEGHMGTPRPIWLAPDEGPLDTLHGLSRANPHRSRPARGEALVLFAGPDADVTPSWYTTPVRSAASENPSDRAAARLVART
jgi:predicted FMN-binding regulatory protein PaiB